jgi:hypothetical protein
MKILKIRRGYTTNSSASSEFIPAPASGPVAESATPAAPLATTPASPAQAVASSVPLQAQPAAAATSKPFPVPVRATTKTTQPAAGQLGAKVSTEPATSQGAQAGSAESAATQSSQLVQPPAVQTPAPAHGWGNTVVFGAFAALVALAFVGERVARHIIRRIRNRDEVN